MHYTKAGKVVQNVLEWSCGVSDYMAKCSKSIIATNLKGKLPVHAKISLIQNYWPLKRYLRVVVLFIAKAVLKTILPFANHRHFLSGAR